MNNQMVIERLQQLAAETASSQSRGNVTSDAGDDNLLRRYGLSSIDALEFLLAVEEEFEIAIDDEDLSEELVSSASRLTHYIMERRAPSSGAGGPG